MCHFFFSSFPIYRLEEIKRQNFLMDFILIHDVNIFINHIKIDSNLFIVSYKRNADRMT